MSKQLTTHAQPVFDELLQHIQQARAKAFRQANTVLIDLYWLIGKTISEDAAAATGKLAVANASALSRNAYKIQLASVAVKRAILQAAG